MAPCPARVGTGIILPKIKNSTLGATATRESASFSGQHEGWLVTVEVLGEEIGEQVEAEGKPLEGITAELKGSREDSISIIVGWTPAERVTRNITAPTHIRIEQAENGADMALQIEASDLRNEDARYETAGNQPSAAER